MYSNRINILGQVHLNPFNSSYLNEYSFSGIAIIILLILFTIIIDTRQCSGSGSIVAACSKQFQSVSRTTWPDVHQTSTSTNPQTLSVTNLHETVVDTSVASSSSTQSQNTLNARETDSFFNNIGQRSIDALTDYKNKQESGGCGLENLGHSCYINSALQCICHIRPFVEIILNLPEQQLLQLPPITSAYRRLLIEMQSILKGSTSAHEVKICISELNRRFAGTDEQDSHEFLAVLIEALHDELMTNYQNSSIGDLMHGTLRSTVKCFACEKETNTDDSFLSLPLPIHRSAAAIFGFDTVKNIFANSMALFGFGIQTDSTLYGCFENLLAEEQLGANGQWFCNTCQKPTDAIKKLDLYQLPRVLILQLKRFTYDLTDDTKITTKIHVEEVLNLGRFVKKDDIDQSTIYDLVAVMAHTGTLTSGHYTTFARHLNNPDWYHYNDWHVHRASFSDAVASDTYVLVYERQH
ncbi:unnamed protein product [Rotaria socialis]|uniref:ubiquitinyl hydrolase 1 n=1 Tax=Rotaria socialis TaxID=392032 RepID=A0A818FVX0_9BILA|nr:unnamed protein product [Rotaria socialis]CAF4677208.1 unnamed protein product [Rotaria socialis]